jgi:crossover junction endodeoxyribonuclease RusA
MVSLTIPGRPAPAVRMTQKSKYQDRPQAYLAYKGYVAQTASLLIRGRPLAWRHVGLCITSYLYGKVEGELPGTRGDWDNYGKAVCDGLQDARVFLNDKSVTDGRSRIRPCASPAEERVEVELWEDDLSLLAN